MALGIKGQPKTDIGFTPKEDIDQVADFAALVGNHRIGTAAERNSLAAPYFYEGLHWTDTDGIFDTWRVRNGAWLRVNRLLHAEFTWDRSAIGDGSIILFSTAADAGKTNDPIATIPGTSGQTITLRDAGLYAISWHCSLGATATGLNTIDVTTSADGLIARQQLLAGQSVGTLNQDNYYAAANTVLTLSIFKATGGTSNVSGRVRITKLGSF